MDIRHSYAAIFHGGYYFFFHKSFQVLYAKGIYTIGFSVILIDISTSTFLSLNSANFASMKSDGL